MLGERLQASLGFMVQSEVILIEVFGRFISKSNTKAVKRSHHLQVYNVDAADYYAIRGTGQPINQAAPSVNKKLGYKIAWLFAISSGNNLYSEVKK